MAFTETETLPTSLVETCPVDATHVGDGVVVNAAEAFKQRRRQTIVDMMNYQRLNRREQVVTFAVRHVQQLLQARPGQMMMRFGLSLEVSKVADITTDNQRRPAWLDAYFINDGRRGPFSEEVITAIGELEPFNGRHCEESFATENYIG